MNNIITVNIIILVVRLFVRSSFVHSFVRLFDHSFFPLINMKVKSQFLNVKYSSESGKFLVLYYSRQNPFTCVLEDH